MTTDPKFHASASDPGLSEPFDELLGIARGLLADERLSDDEIGFLSGWLNQHRSIARQFPGDVIHDRVRAVLEDGVVTEEERSHLVDTLNMLIQNRLADLAERVDLTELWFDDAGTIGFGGSKFCLTGKFVFGSPGLCRSAIEQRSGIVTASVGDDTNFLVVGGLGLDEWRSGGLGVEIEKAMRLRATGRPVKIIPEDALVAQFR
jgi:NAD-dependent DNA ligase